MALSAPLDQPLKTVLRTTQNHLRRLNQLGILTIRDFFLYFPRTYTDARELRKIAQLAPDEMNTTQGQIKSIFGRKTKTGKFFVRLVLFDETAALEVIFFNQPHLLHTLKAKDWIMVSGKLKTGKQHFTMINPRVEPVREEQIHGARLVPIYPETELQPLSKTPRSAASRNAAAPHGKISSKWIREKLFPLLPYADHFEEFLPEDIPRDENLFAYRDALRLIHFPETEEDIERSRKRLAFDELFLLQLAALKRKYAWRKIASAEKKNIPVKHDVVEAFLKKLPFGLTESQKKTLQEILDDLAKPYPMSRLVEGDVGSGKTIVTAIAALNVVKNGFQACLMAPTEILTKQHYHTFMRFLQPEGLNIQCIVGSTPDAQKKIIVEQMKTGRVDIVIGTHALIQENIGFRKLGLAIIDEQHRFGVKQREKLKSFGSPHLLSLSATPIPRTLALTIYGDQDLSLIDEMPKGRQQIITRLVPETKRMDAYRWVEDQVRKGRQVYIICPLIDAAIDESELSIKAATEEYKRLKNEIFPDLKLGLLHGRLKSKEKNAIHEAFAKNEIQILVSTSVVEVGIDVPNATIIIMEGAERFGLAQLHQFRGRVGRGTHQSYCFLFPTIETEESAKRLKTVCQYSSGFKLAEIDLELRGAGEIYGIRQSGMPDLKMASFSDIELIQKARRYAEMIIRNDPKLQTLPKLRKKLDEIETDIAIDY